MHELSIIENTLELAVQSARSSGATQIHRLCLRVGALTGVVPEALQFAFDVARLNTMASEAHLEIENVSARAWCANCQTEFQTEDWVRECPRCGNISAELRHGLELELVSVEIS